MLQSEPLHCNAYHHIEWIEVNYISIGFNALLSFKELEWVHYRLQRQVFGNFNYLHKNHSNHEYGLCKI